MTNHTTMASPIDLEKLKAFDSCTISNAIERLNVRLRNEGFLSGPARCRFPNLPPIAGYAATARIRTSSPPMSHRCYYDRMDWWHYVASLPEPRILVLQDTDHQPAFGAFVGEIHAAIGTALKCVGCITNGAVRDLPAVEAMGFQLYARRTSDLLHGDRHGVVNIPLSIAAELPAEASRVVAEEQELVEFCRSSRFSLHELAERVRKMNVSCDLPWRLPK
jgi:4-hydroxy-4-methyl-2-oxoglutarate aldolase